MESVAQHAMPVVVVCIAMPCVSMDVSGEGDNGRGRGQAGDDCVASTTAATDSQWARKQKVRCDDSTVHERMCESRALKGHRGGRLE